MAEMSLNNRTNVDMYLVKKYSSIALPNDNLLKYSKMLGNRIKSVCLEDVLCTNNVIYYVSRK